MKRLLKPTLLLSTLMFASCQAGLSVPSPTASPDAKTYSYSPPATLRLMPECTENKEPIVQYQLTAEGEFSFPTADGPVNLFEENEVPLTTVKITSTEQAAFQKNLPAYDLAAHFENSEKVPADAPRTEECRTVSDIQLQVNGEPQAYDLNGRDYIHTDEYRKQWEALQTEFETLAKKYRDNTPIPTEPKYAFPPLKLVNNGECGMGTQTRYEIQAFDKFVSYSSTGEVKTSRDLTASEREALSQQLNDSDLAQKFESSTPIPEDAPQTKECRTVQELHMPVYGVPQVYNLNGRTHSHTEAYRTAFTEITELLESFDK